MKSLELNLIFSEKTLDNAKYIAPFSADCFPFSLPSIISMLKHQIQFAIEGLDTVFTDVEKDILSAAFLTTLIAPDRRTKEILALNVEALYIYEPSTIDALDEKKSVNKHEFIDKLKKLNEFEAFSVIQMSQKSNSDSDIDERMAEIIDYLASPEGIQQNKDGFRV